MPPTYSARSPAAQLSQSSPKGDFPFYGQSCVLYHSLHSTGMRNPHVFAGFHGAAWILQYGTGIQLQLFGSVCHPRQNIYILLQSACGIQSLSDFLKVLNKTKFLRQKKEQKKCFYQVQDQRENS